MELMARGLERPTTRSRVFPGGNDPLRQFAGPFGKCMLFLGVSGALRQLSQLAEGGSLFVSCYTVMLFWPSANCKLGETGRDQSTAKGSGAGLPLPALRGIL